ncbi:MAG: hypothetical protein ACF8CQ_08560, partial [Rhodopirellula sp. JB044]|uniref:hypothetical protein n=1 Tax=Rhodopirellula sp. JB044 TaxID=3342844 RepID=UPI00370A285A
RLLLILGALGRVLRGSVLGISLKNEWRMFCMELVRMVSGASCVQAASRSRLRNHASAGDAVWTASRLGIVFGACIGCRAGAVGGGDVRWQT